MTHWVRWLAYKKCWFYQGSDEYPEGTAYISRMTRLTNVTLFLSWWTDLWINIWATNMGYRWILNIASQLVHLSCKQRCLLGWYSFYSLYTTICRGFITVDVVLIPIKPRWPQVALAGGALAKGGGGICVPGIGWNICVVWTMVFTIKY